MASSLLSALPAISSVADADLFYAVQVAGPSDTKATRLQLLTAFVPTAGAGNPITLTASGAFAGSAAAGGDVILSPGAGDGAGHPGAVRVNLPGTAEYLDIRGGGGTGADNMLVTKTGGLALTSGFWNYMFGTNAGAAMTTAIGNCAMGHDALSALTTGTSNIGIGTSALQRCTTGSNNTAISNEALAFNLDSSGNTAIGEGTLRDMTSGSGNNTACGYSALEHMGNATGNVALGFQAGGTTHGPQLTTGGNNTFLGTNTSPASATANHRTIVGCDAVDTGLDSSVTLGRTVDTVCTPGLRQLSAVAAVAAAGSTQGTATALTNEVSVVTTATVATQTGVLLPTPPAAGSQPIVVVNGQSVTISIYPAVGGQINALGANVPLTLASGLKATLFSSSATQWWT